jgi:outer membrane protein
VRNAALTLETAAARIEAAKAGREAAETQLRAEQERYGVGLSTNFFVLTRQNELAQAALTETAALTDYRRALTDFARSTGVLLDERHIEIAGDAPAVKVEGGK